MRQLLRRLAVAALLAPAAAAGAATMIASPAEAAPVKPTEQALQTEVNRLVNVERTKGGCTALTVSAQLTAAARDHSAWMARTGTFSHTGSGGSSFVTRSEAAGYASPSGENIAWGYRTASDVVSGWMNSPGHRANILNCRSKAVGVGVVHSASGTPYYTQDFGF
ncbi:CAP domain-containing protein [Actinoplanes subglobosus]|uniref:CAP domain-containing protein n=1 Tax=Actinoplanes subglobosus TaxID=1547892 RepID=A0ABV8J7Z3_9ACTN